METLVGVDQEGAQGKRRFSVPAKKTEPIQIRGEGVSQADELLDAFNKARQPKAQIAALEQIIKSHQQFKEPKQLQPIIATIENMTVRNQKNAS